MEMQTNNVSIYACGGCGINIVGSFAMPDSAAIAATTSYAIDTSKANLHDAKFQADKLYLFDGVDGSGMERSQNHPLIAKNAQNILQKFKPGDFNIVVHSGGGGSGAVIGASLVNALLADGQQVVVIMVGGTGSQKEVENTGKAIKTYAVMAERGSFPVVMHYLENSPKTSREQIDSGAHAAIQVLLTLFSGRNAELDKADLRSWIKHAGDAELFSLQFCPTLEAYAQAGNVTSVISLAQRSHNTGLEPSPAFQKVGYVRDPQALKSLEHPLHFTLSGNLVDQVARSLHAKQMENDKRLKATPKRDSLLGGGDKIADNGIVL